MKTRLLCLPLLAAASLAACGGATPPVPASPKPEPVAETAPPARAPAAEPAPAAAPARPPAPTVGGLERYAVGEAIAAIPADAIGGSPVMNRDDAWMRATEAVKKYCEDNAMKCEGFYAKERAVERDGFWTIRFFGMADGQGAYIGVRVYPEGRAEIVR